MGEAPWITSSTFTKLDNGYLLFSSYSGGAAGLVQDDNPTAAQYGIINTVVAESLVPLPEPSSAAVVMILVGYIGLKRRMV